MNPKVRNGIVLTVTSALVLVLSSVLVYFDIVNEYWAGVLTLAGINVIIAIGLNVISGFTGQLALGHAGFMAIGAYTAAVCVMKLGIPMLPAIVIAAIVTAAFGFLIGYPTLKLSGDYLAIVTLGFGEIIRVLMINLPDITGGAAGLKDIPSFTSNIVMQPTMSYFWVTLAVIVVVAAVANFMRSSYGRAIISIREDEIASSAMGINTYRYKMFAFTMSAFIAGIGGALYAFYEQYLNPSGFGFLKSVDFLIIVVLGGMGSITGTIISGYVLTIAQEFLRVVQDYRLVIYSIVLIIIMIFWPGGLMGRKEFSITDFSARIRARSRKEV